MGVGLWKDDAAKILGGLSSALIDGCKMVDVIVQIPKSDEWIGNLSGQL